MTGTFRHVVDIHPSPSIRQLPGVRGLFQQRVAGDDALLGLAALRFAQAGMPFELYADTPAEVERLLRYVPHHQTRPTVHLNRGVNLLDHDSHEAVLAFVTQLDDRVSGLIVHDKPGMLEQVPALNDALPIVSDRAHGPHVFLEYAVGAPLDWVADIARRAADIEHAGVCVDIGHIGLAEVHRRLGASLPGTAHLSANDPALADHGTQVQQATRAALSAVLSLIDELGALGSTVHFHLHNGHPAIPGLSDHFGFLTRVPVPFEFDGARSLAPMFGPTGLARILHRAVTVVGPHRLSLTLEIHQAEGRLPLDPEVSELFAHWRDHTNAERFNYWLSVIAANHMLATTMLAQPWE